MKNFKLFFLDTGSYSIMRLMTFIVVITGCNLALILSIIDMIKSSGANLLNIGALSGGLIGIGLGGKVLQKKDEVKVEGRDSSNPSN